MMVVRKRQRDKRDFARTGVWSAVGLRVPRTMAAREPGTVVQDGSEVISSENDKQALQRMYKVVRSVG